MDNNDTLTLWNNKYKLSNPREKELENVPVPKKINDWFSLENYKPSKEPEYWMAALANRLSITGAIDLEYELGLESRSNSLLKEFYLMVKGTFSSKLSGLNLAPTISPISELSLNKLGKLYWTELLAAVGNDKAETLNDYFRGDFKTLRRTYHTSKGEGWPDMTLGTEDLSSIRLVREGKAEAIIDAEDIKKIQEPVGSIENEDTSFPESLLRVNMALEEEVLMEEFKKYIRSKKNSLNDTASREKALSGIDFSKWYANGVLPYIDLTLWEDIAGVELTNQQIANLLWPNHEFNGADKLRRSTQRYVKEFLSYQTLSSLRFLCGEYQ